MSNLTPPELAGYRPASPAEAIKWMVDNPMGEAVHGDTWIRFNPEIRQYEEKYHFHPLPSWEPVASDLDFAFRYQIPMENSNG